MQLIHSRIYRRAFALGLVSLAVSRGASAQSDSFRAPSPSTHSILIDQTYAQDGTEDISALGTVGSLGVSGVVTLTSELGYVRVILETGSGDEYLVYETNAMLSAAGPTQLENTCEETCALGMAEATRLRFEMEDATFALHAVASTDASPNVAAQARTPAALAAVKQAQLADKIQRVQKQIERKGYRWSAGYTPVAALSYADKKLFACGPLTNWYGLEYYRGGVFERPPDSAAQKAAASDSPYVSDFSWEDRHGQSWLTPVKSQGGCGSCWAFAATGATELLANLYFNRHLDLDLSEQDGLSCSGAGSCAGGSSGPTLLYYANEGVVDESCFPYAAADLMCSEKCASPKEHARIGGITDFQNWSQTDDELKALILKGAVSGGVSWWWHALVLVGYRVLQAGDEIYLNSDTNGEGSIVIPEGDPLIGKTAWRFKNSWGDTWGDAGYVYVVTDVSNLYMTSGVNGPVTSPNFSDRDIVCEDEDDDGYYNWGVGPKPATCPASARAEPDGNDADTCLGPSDAYGYLAALCNTKPIDLGCISKPNFLRVDGRVDLTISKWPWWWKLHTPKRVLVTFRAAHHERLDGIAVELNGTVTELSGHRQELSMPFTWQEKVLLKVSAAEARKMIVSWRAQLSTPTGAPKSSARRNQPSAHKEPDPDRPAMLLIAGDAGRRTGETLAR